jgi:hypothetical protein
MNVPPGWVWDFLSVRRVSRVLLQRYLTRTFGKHEFTIKVRQSNSRKVQELILSTAPGVAKDSPD